MLKDLVIKSQRCKTKWLTIFVLLLYLILSLLLLHKFQYLVNSDGISYISIAKKYAMGNFKEAINGHWSPLYCWLLIPFLWVTKNPIMAGKILNLFIGIFTLWGFMQLLHKYEITNDIKKIIILSFIPVVVLWEFWKISPDLLFLGILFLYLNIILAEKYKENIYYAGLCGFLGAIGYLAKSYMFALFLVHFSLVSFLNLIKKDNRIEKKSLIVKFTVTILTFSVLSGIWIFLISSKYNAFSITNTNRLARSSIKPGFKGHWRNGFPHYSQGLFIPPNKTAISAWEDPSFLPYQKWSPFDSRENFIHQIKIIKGNIIKTFDLLQGYSVFSVPIIIISIFISLSSLKKKDAFKNKIIKFSIIIGLIFTSGYMTVLIVSRYLLLIYALITLLGAHLIGRMWSQSNSRILKKIKLATTIIFALSFVLTSLWEINKLQYSGKFYQNISRSLKRNIKLEGNIASDRRYTASLVIAYYQNVKYFGMIEKEKPFREVKKSLEWFDINYFIMWNNKNKTLMNNFDKLYPRVLPKVHLPFIMYLIKPTKSSTIDIETEKITGL